MTTVTLPVASSGNSTVTVAFSTSMSTDISVTVFPSTFKFTVFEVLFMYLPSPANTASIV